MPIYLYHCPTCENQKEVIHSMSEVDIPTESTLKNTTCCQAVMKRKITGFNINGDSSPTRLGQLASKRSKAFDKKHELKQRKAEQKRKGLQIM